MSLRLLRRGARSLSTKSSSVAENALRKARAHCEKQIAAADEAQRRADVARRRIAELDDPRLLSQLERVIAQMPEGAEPATEGDDVRVSWYGRWRAIQLLDARLHYCGTLRFGLAYVSISGGCKALRVCDGQSIPEAREWARRVVEGNENESGLIERFSK